METAAAANMPFVSTYHADRLDKKVCHQNNEVY
jgi:hypothetical protein